jgi:hypothetical protein
MLDLYNVPLFLLFNLYLIIIFLLGIALRVHQYRAILGIVRAVPSRWPKLFELVKQHRNIFLTWSNVWPLLATLALFACQTVGRYFLWDKTQLTAAELVRLWPVLPVVGLCAVAMLLFDIGGAFQVGTINRTEVERSLDQAEYWLKSWAAPVLRVFTLGYLNPRRLVTNEVRKALTEASKSLSIGLWWSTRQTLLRILCALSLWTTSLLEQPLTRLLYGEGATAAG